VTAKGALRFGREYLARLQRDRATGVAAELAYSFLFAVFPFLIFAVTVLAYTDIKSEDVLALTARHVPGPLLETIEEAIRDVLDRPKRGLLSVGMLVALVAASRAANQAVYAINQAYETSPERPFLEARLLALGVTVLLVLVVGVSFLLPVLGWVLERFSSFLGLSSAFLAFWKVTRWVLSLAVNAGGLLVIYYLAPNLRLRFREAIPGALLASLGWQAVSFGFSLYLSRFANYSAIYGSLGGVIALMVWFYLIGLLLILGAELNAQLHARGSGERGAGL
jgi:membrane protein